MYYYLKGTIDLIKEDYAIIDVNGVGYEFLYINKDDFKENEEVKVYTLHLIREDDEFLVGFKTLEEKKIFSELISVKGIGPKTAVNALRGTSIVNFMNMIQNDDLKGLKKLPGIGPKAASQILLDLKGSINIDVINQVPTKQKLNPEQNDAKLVLKSLGFKEKEIDEALSSLPTVLNASQYVNEALKILSK